MDLSHHQANHHLPDQHQQQDLAVPAQVLGLSHHQVVQHRPDQHQQQDPAVPAQVFGLIHSPFPPPVPVAVLPQPLSVEGGVHTDLHYQLMPVLPRPPQGGVHSDLPQLGDYSVFSLRGQGNFAAKLPAIAA